MSSRLFMWLHREQGFSSVYCPQESVLSCRGISVMQADRRAFICVSICVCFVCVKGKMTLTDFPEAFSSH